jgi:hypothetical protein
MFNHEDRSCVCRVDKQDEAVNEESDTNTEYTSNKSFHRSRVYPFKAIDFFDAVGGPETHPDEEKQHV